MANPQLTKTCIVCGIQKPLAAFLQMTGAQGTLYGNVCSSCRGPGAQLDEKISLIEEDQSGASSGLIIDSKAKNLAEIKEKKYKHDKFMSDHDELKKRDELATDKEEKTTKKQKSEKDHRVNFIEAKKKQGFLPFQEKKGPTESQRNRLIETRIAGETQQQELDNKTQEENIKTDIRTNNIDLNDPLLQLNKLGAQTSTFHNFVTRLGSGTAFAQRIRQLGKQIHGLGNDVKQEKSSTQEKDVPSEYVNKNWPSSRR